MCEKWVNSFAAFIDHMGPCPKGHSLDRIDNERGYEAGNCRWTDATTQANNRRCTMTLMFNGALLPVSDVARHLGVPVARLKERKRRGWSDEDTVTQPFLGRGGRLRAYRPE